MSIAAVTWALEQWKRKDITASERVVLMALADHHNKETGKCCPSQKLLADECGLTDRGVRKQLVSLEEKGIINRRGVFENNVQIGVNYTLCMGAEPRSTRAEWGAEPRSTRTEEPNGLDKSNPCRARGTRLQVDWRPEPLDPEFLKKHSLTDQVCADQLDRFRDYWLSVPGQRGVKLDWQATWRNWLRKAVENRAAGPPRRQTAFRNTMDGLAEYLADDDTADQAITGDVVRKLSFSG